VNVDVGVMVGEVCRHEGREGDSTFYDDKDYPYQKPKLRMAPCVLFSRAKCTLSYTQWGLSK